MLRLTLGIAMLALALPAFSNEETEEVRWARGGFRDYKFVRDTSNPALGEAWRDESGLIWGDAVQDMDGQLMRRIQSSEFENQARRAEGKELLPVDYQGAKEYCERIGASLPTRDEYESLFYYMGTCRSSYPCREGAVYTPQVLPHFNPAENNSGHSYIFWTSTVSYNFVDWAWYFSSEGYYNQGSRRIGYPFGHELYFRCVDR